MSEKKCCKCGESFPQTTEYFHKDRQKKDGLYSQCKNCRKRTKPKTVLSKEEILARKREYRRRLAETNPELHESRLKRKRELQRARRKANPNRYVEYQNQYRKSHPEQLKIDARIWSANRRAREANAEGSYTKKDVAKQMKIQGNLCYWCRENLSNTGYDIDHVIPLSRGGTNYPNNIVLSCPKCNKRKGSKMPEEWKIKLTQGKLF